MLVGGQLHAPAALPPGRRPGTFYTDGWVVPKAGLDGAENCYWNSIPGPSKPWRIAVPTELSRPIVFLDIFCNFFLDTSTMQLTHVKSNYWKNNFLWGRVLTEKLTGHHLFKKFPRFVWPECLLSLPQAPASFPYPESPLSSPCLPIPLLEHPF